MIFRAIKTLVVLICLFTASGPVAGETGGLWVQGYNGGKLQLSAATVSRSWVEATTVGFDNATEENPVFLVHFKLTPLAAELFGRMTEANIGKPMKFLLGENVVAAPVVRSSILGGYSMIPTRSKITAKRLLEAMSANKPERRI